MTTEEKNLLNKLIRNYQYPNTFMDSLKKALKSSVKKEELGKRQIKVLSDKQYEAAKNILNG
jgi:hypothetical protein